MKRQTKIILIGGTSHCGKSTLAEEFKVKMGVDVIATDSLTRHPGRPWKGHIDLIPPHVQDYYATRTTTQLMEEVYDHYQGLWPKIQAIIEEQVQKDQLSVIEGSALLPSLLKNIDIEGLYKVWLYATPNFLKNRMYQSSNYSSKTEEEQFLIDQFLRRAITFNEWVRQECTIHGLRLVNVELFLSNDALSNELLTSLV